MKMPARGNREGELSGVIATFRGVFYSVGAFSLVINVLLLAPAIYMLQVYDRVLSSRNETTLYMLSMILVGLYALEALLELLRSKVMIRASAALDLRLNERVFNASFERYMRGRGASPNQALGDLAGIRQFLTGKGLFAFFDAPWTPLFIFVIFLLNPWLGLFALVSALILLVLAYVNERATGEMLEEASRVGRAANHYAATNLRNAEVIDAHGMLPRLRERWFARQGRYLAVQGNAAERGATVGAVTKFFRLTMQSGILGVGALLVIDNQLTPGAMIAASILLGRALAPVDLAIGTWRGLVAARAAYGRVRELLAAVPARAPTIALPRPEGRVSAEQLIMMAPGTRQPILKGINFTVNPGSIVAVVGPSAAGKSTLARALVGVWPPANGTLRLDGAEVFKWNKEELGPWIGYLPQDVELFEGTVAENIARFGELDSERIVQAARRAGVHEMILRLPESYETAIGEGGAVLSGGQRQRIALARALYGEPALVVLDEPNANLDEAGEAALVAAIEQMKEDRRTVFVMTHRPNVLRVVDSVMVLVGGMLRAYGPPDTVMKGLKPVPTAAAVEAPKGDDVAAEEAA